MDSKQVCVCSFPKSGNTWVRHIIGHLFKYYPIEESVPDMYTDKLFLSPINTKRGDFYFYKSHSSQLDDIVKYTNRKVDFVIHIRRNPLDVFCSQLNYISERVTGFADANIDIPVPSAEDLKGTEELEILFHAFCTFGTLINNFKDAGSWFRSNLFWYEMSKQHSHIISIRYEDLMSDPVNTLGFMKDLFGVTSDDLQEALEKAEQATRKDGKFYWRKSVGTYKEFLTDSSLKTFWNLHGETCEKIGYQRPY